MSLQKKTPRASHAQGFIPTYILPMIEQHENTARQQTSLQCLAHRASKAKKTRICIQSDSTTIKLVASSQTACEPCDVHPAVGDRTRQVPIGCLSRCMEAKGRCPTASGDPGELRYEPGVTDNVTCRTNSQSCLESQLRSQLRAETRVQVAHLPSRFWTQV